MSVPCRTPMLKKSKNQNKLKFPKIAQISQNFFYSDRTGFLLNIHSNG